MFKWFGRAALAAALVVAAGAGAFIGQRSNGAAGAAAQTPSGYITLNPGRVLDTRPQYRINYGAAKPVGGQTIRVPGVAGASSLAVNITMTETDGPGFLAAWDGNGSHPNVSIINATTAGENIANFAVVPAAADGSFALWTYDGTHVVVDLMGYFPAGSAPVPNGVTGAITGYGPGSTITVVSGTVTNGTALERSVRVDVRCPNGTVEIDYAFDIAAGSTQGWSVICDGAFTTGASILQIVDV